MFTYFGHLLAYKSPKNMLYLTQVTNQWRLCFKTPLKQGRENPCAHTGFLVMARRRISCPAWVGLGDLGTVLSVFFLWATHKRKWSLSCSSFDLFWMHWVTKTNVLFIDVLWASSVVSVWRAFKKQIYIKRCRWRFQEIEGGPSGLSILAQHIEVVHFYKYLCPTGWEVLLVTNTDALYTKAQSQLFFLWRLRFSGVCVMRLSQWWPVLSLMLLCTDKTPSGWTSWWESQLCAWQEAGHLRLWLWGIHWTKWKL